MIQTVKNLPAVWEMQVQSRGQEDPGWEDATLSIFNPYDDFWDSLVAQMVKNLPAMQVTWV